MQKGGEWTERTSIAAPWMGKKLSPNWSILDYILIVFWIGHMDGSPAMTFRYCCSHRAINVACQTDQSVVAARPLLLNLYKVGLLFHELGTLYCIPNCHMSHSGRCDWTISKLINVWQLAMVRFLVDQAVSHIKSCRQASCSARPCRSDGFSIHE